MNNSHEIKDAIKAKMAYNKTRPYLHGKSSVNEDAFKLDSTELGLSTSYYLGAVSAWRSISPALRCSMTYVDFEAGWNTAMQSVWEQMPLEEFWDDPSPNDISRVGKFIKSNINNKTRPYLHGKSPLVEDAFKRAVAEARDQVYPDRPPFARIHPDVQEEYFKMFCIFLDKIESAKAKNFNNLPSSL